jgi:probable phosphoglycerate mutase
MFGRDANADVDLSPAVQEAAGRRFMETLQWSSYPDTETGAELRRRLHGVLEDIVAAHQGHRVVVVSHAGAISAFVAGLLGAGPDMFFFAGHASVSRVFHGDSRFVTHSLNEVAHLRERKALTF